MKFLLINRFLLAVLILGDCIRLSAQEVQQPDDSTLAWTLNRQAHAAFSDGKHDEALFFIQSSIQKYIEDPSLDADNYLLMAEVFDLKHSDDNALKYYLRAVNASEKLNNPEILMNAYRRTGDFFFGKKTWLKAAEYYQKAQMLTSKEETSDLSTKMGICYFNLKDFQKSDNAFAEALFSLSESEYATRIEVLSYRSKIGNKTNSYDKSLRYDQEILEIYRSLGNQRGMQASLNNVAFDYVHLQQYQQAIEVFSESLSLAEKMESPSGTIIELLINIGICYQNANDLKKALAAFRKAYGMVGNTTQELPLKAEIENIMAVTHYYSGDLYNAELYSKNSINSSIACNNRNLLQVCYFTYSQILKTGNDYIKALEYYEMHLALKDSLEREMQRDEQLLSQKNLDIEKREKELRLKLAEEEMSEIELKRVKLEAEKKQQEYDLLRKQNELEVSEKERILQSLVLARQEQEAELRSRELRSLEQEKAIKDLQLRQKEAEKKEQEKEISLLQVEKERQYEARKRAIYTAVLTALIGILILIGLITTRRKNATLARQKKEIEEKNDALEDKNQEILTQTEHIISQKKLIEEKNLAITDSIQYASRIQEAVLTPADDIRRLVDDCFILFRPRDIVSGDFYWGAAKDGKVLIAAADCTGHGVPGAFMSMLGIALLNEITASRKITDAATILNELRTNVIAALRQKGREGEAQDGMDMVICIIDKQKGIMQFAGANNPLIHIRNGDLTVIKGDRMPIGIHINIDTPFTNHSIEIQKSDAFYIFSDGMADQFGGPDNKKLKNTAMQQLLLEVHTFPFKQQQEIIERRFDEWKGNNEQVDDILVIGFRVE